MPVYFIQAGDQTGPVKIGHGDPQSRMQDCQVGNHLELRIIRIFEGGKPEENVLHSRFEDLWIRGEWHNFTRAMLGDVGLVEIPIGEPIGLPAEAPVAKQIGAHVALLRKSKKLNQDELAQAVGITRATIANIESGRNLPGATNLLKLSRFFGLSFADITDGQVAADDFMPVAAAVQPQAGEAA